MYSHVWRLGSYGTTLWIPTIATWHRGAPSSALMFKEYGTAVYKRTEACWFAWTFQQRSSFMVLILALVHRISWPPSLLSSLRHWQWLRCTSGLPSATLRNTSPQWNLGSPSWAEIHLTTHGSQSGPLLETPTPLGSELGTVWAGGALDTTGHMASWSTTMRALGQTPAASFTFLLVQAIQQKTFWMGR